jgi:DNA-binding response OmpR family regulator
MKHIYLVEDHLTIRESVERYLTLSGYKVSSFSLLKTALSAIKQKEPDLLIQDVMIPDGDGFLFVKQLREEYTFPVIFMTARGSESDRITGFELGGDDYIVKPFSPKELVLRIEAVLRRINQKDSQKEQESFWTVEDSKLRFSIEDHTCFVDDIEIFLTAAEWKILELLIENSGSLVTRKSILERCFNYSLSSYDRIVDTHIKNIRSKLGKGKNIWIETVRGYGYRFIATRSRGAGGEL